MSATTLNKTAVGNQATTRLSINVWQALVGALGIVTIIAMGIYLVTAMNFRSRPFIGAMVTHTLVVNAGQPTGDSFWPGFAAESRPGLRSGDQIIQLNGESLFPTEARTDFSTAFANYTAFFDNLTVGQSPAPIDVVFLRPGTSSAPYCEFLNESFSTCSLAITPLAFFPTIDFFVFFIMPFATALAIIGFVAVMFRHKWQTREGAMGIAIALCTAIYTGGLFDIGTLGVLSPILDGKRLPPVALIRRLNTLAGAHGIGRSELFEDRLVGFKSREVYETPAATTLYLAKRALEELTLSKDILQVREQLSVAYGRCVYNGQWFGDLRGSLDAFFERINQSVTGKVRVSLYKGNARVTSRESENSLYSEEMLSHGEGTRFDCEATMGFIKLWSIPLAAEARRQKNETQMFKNSI